MKLYLNHNNFLILQVDGIFYNDMDLDEEDFPVYEKMCEMRMDEEEHWEKLVRDIEETQRDRTLSDILLNMILG
jgi:hypothetical protein